MGLLWWRLQFRLQKNDFAAGWGVLQERFEARYAVSESLLFEPPKRSNQEKGGPTIAPRFARCPALLADGRPAPNSAIHGLKQWRLSPSAGCVTRRDTRGELPRDVSLQAEACGPRWSHAESTAAHLWEVQL